MPGQYLQGGCLEQVELEAVAEFAQFYSRTCSRIRENSSIPSNKAELNSHESNYIAGQSAAVEVRSG